MSRIVVGVDGSACGELALRWACEEAELRGATLRVVAAYEGVGAEADQLAAMDDLEQRARREAEQVLDLAVAEVARQHPGLPVERAAVDGDPPDVLVEEAREADLLVVGSRGRGGVAGLLLGSVSQACVQQAQGAVVVVRE